MSSSATTTTTSESRSPSPSTPSSSSSLDSPGRPTVSVVDHHHPGGASANLNFGVSEVFDEWRSEMMGGNAGKVNGFGWGGALEGLGIGGGDGFGNSKREEAADMLALNDLIHHHVYDDSIMSPTLFTHHPDLLTPLNPNTHTHVPNNSNPQASNSASTSTSTTTSSSPTSSPVLPSSAPQTPPQSQTQLTQSQLADLFMSAVVPAANGAIGVNSSFGAKVVNGASGVNGPHGLHGSSMGATKAVPPPPPRPRKRDAAIGGATDRVVFPAKESCYNLPIIIPSIPESGTKSRVETQVRVTLDLASPSTPISELGVGEGFTYDKVGTWKWLKLPKGTSTKKRSRKDGKIDPAPEEVLHLNVEVTCASPPHAPVASCSSCQSREAKRVARKIAARVRPAREESDSGPEADAPSPSVSASHSPQPTTPKHEDTSSIIQFNCSEILDFSTGSVALPLRITCYCRHHREKVGFFVHFTLSEGGAGGRVVGRGRTRGAIMITDDHKSSGGSRAVRERERGEALAHLSGSGAGVSPVLGRVVAGGPTGQVKRKHAGGTKDGSATKRRAKAPLSSQSLDTGMESSDPNANAFGSSRKASVCSSNAMSPEPSASASGYTAASTPQYMTSAPTSAYGGGTTLPSTPSFTFGGSDFSDPEQAHPQAHTQVGQGRNGQYLPSPAYDGLTDGFGRRGSELVGGTQDLDAETAATLLGTADALACLNPSAFLPTAPPSPVSPSINRLAPPQPSHVATAVAAASLPFLFNFNSPAPPMTQHQQHHMAPPQPLQIAQSMLALPPPKIHRLIPSSGPTFGGIEITILGANFHPSLLSSSSSSNSGNGMGGLNCVFGGVVASSTARWSDNTLVCVLPPRATAGVVPVWLEGFGGDKDGEDESVPPLMFTYVDESDRALMELALQVVGLKMTGKLEDAKNVAMRIVGNAGTDDNRMVVDSGNMMMQVASASAAQSSALTGCRDVRPLLLSRANDGGDFESLIINFLSLLDTPQGDDRSRTDIPTSDAISHQTPSGQTLLHLASILNFPSLVQFLIDHDVKLDVRDRNGYSATHFAAIAKSKACLRLLVDAGAALDLENVRGETPEDVSPESFDGLFEEAGDSDGDLDWSAPHRRMDQEEEDEEATWGDAEEDSGDETASGFHHHRLHRRITRRINRSAPDSGLTELATNLKSPLPPTSSLSLLSEKQKEKMPETHPEVDEKQAASFVNMIQRTLSQGIMPNMPNLPFPNIPGMPAVHWGALQQIPMVFPVYVPIPGWPAFLGNEKRGEQSDSEGESSQKRAGNNQTQAWAGSVLSAHEWRAVWERWMKQNFVRQEVEEVPPPAYTPRAEEKTPEPVVEVESESDSQPQPAVVPLPMASERTASRRVAYGTQPIPDQEVNAYAYRPTKKQGQKLQKKHDRMLILFWIPMLFIGFMWAFFTAIRIGIHVLRATVPLKAGLRL
ncbi:hypothetical protein JAAARDRAFT_35333 [Jaapia argillacea MUCL 33604]|uniref:IPT/TIG domain-containing protein n=1 Tax=Jaapia argillacea MUCL 33604 TaxID=933084 RepID=A0A067PS50_9AGAM|nr:hypothetical protein JAAARDRAFT_35333 [Jaapia argillacea MUCL 33604]